MMTARIFTKTIEDFYGQYKDMQRKVVENWASQRTGEYLATLAQTLFEQYSARYGVPPGIPEFKAVTDDVISRIEDRQRQQRQMQQLSEARKQLDGPGGGEWQEIEYNGRKMTRAAAYLQALIDGMAMGIHPRNNHRAKSILGGM